MTGKSNGASRSPNGADVYAPLFNLAGFQISQKIALESARFAARRMRAYADQMEALSRCDNPQAVFAAQTDFLKQMQQDYAAETEAVKDIFAEASDSANGAAQQR